jgi:hypothetical protein
MSGSINRSTHLSVGVLLAASVIGGYSNETHWNDVTGKGIGRDQCRQTELLAWHKSMAGKPQPALTTCRCGCSASDNLHHRQGIGQVF